MGPHRRAWWQATVDALDAQLQTVGHRLLTLSGPPAQALTELVQHLQAAAARTAPPTAAPSRPSTSGAKTCRPPRSRTAWPTCAATAWRCTPCGKAPCWTWPTCPSPGPGARHLHPVPASGGAFGPSHCPGTPAQAHPLAATPTALAGAASHLTLVDRRQPRGRPAHQLPQPQPKRPGGRSWRPGAPGPVLRPATAPQLQSHPQPRARVRRVQQAVAVARDRCRLTPAGHGRHPPVRGQTRRQRRHVLALVRTAVARPLPPAAPQARAHAVPRPRPGPHATAPAQRRRVPALVHRPHRRAAGGRRHARTGCHRLAQQPDAADRRQLPHSRPAGRLARRRCLVRGPAHRPRRVQQPRQLALHCRARHRPTRGRRFNPTKQTLEHDPDGHYRRLWGTLP